MKLKPAALRNVLNLLFQAGDKRSNLESINGINLLTNAKGDDPALFEEIRDRSAIIK